VNDAFKVPVGYFLIDGLGGTERANLDTQCLSRLHDAGVLVVSLTFEGSSANLAMLKTWAVMLMYLVVISRLILSIWFLTMTSAFLGSMSYAKTSQKHSRGKEINC